MILAALRKKQTVIFASLLVTALGIYSFVTLPIDAFPDVTNNQVEIISYADGLSALEIEKFVTFPIETSMRGLPKVKLMRSVTKFGLSIVSIIFDDDVDIYFARQLVFERLTEAKENVPEHVEISLGPVATVMGEIYQYTLEGNMPEDSTGKVNYLTELRSLQEWTVSPLLKNVTGVNEINSFGGYFRQYQVTVEPDKLVKFGVTYDDISRAIQNNNRNTGGNTLERNSEQSIIRSTGLITETADIGAIAVKTIQGTPVYLRDVAVIKVGQAVRQGAALKNGGQECVGGIVMMLRGENSRDVVSRVKQKVDEINSSKLLPGGIKIVPFYDRTEIVNDSVGTVSRALLEGIVLVLLVLYFFLRSFRGSFVVLAALPLSLLVTFIVMKLTGLSANLMSLGGLAISIGMIIDATIIQVENVQRHLSESGKEVSRTKTVLRAVMEVRNPSIFGELIIALTFIPILTLEGIEGKMFSPLAYTVAIALFVSLFLSIFVIPAFCSVFLRREPEKESFILKGVKIFYLPLLRFVMKKKSAVIVAVSSLLIMAFIIIPSLGTEFIPIMDEDAFDMDVQLLPGISLSKAVEVNQLIGEKLKQFDELDIAVARIGQTGVALDTRGVDKTGYVGVLKPKHERKRQLIREELADEMRDELSDIPGISIGFSQPIQCRIDEIVAGTRAQLIIKLFGDDLEILKTKADEIGAALSSMDGIEDLLVETITGQPYLTISINRHHIARYGISVSDVQNVIDMAVAGKKVSRFYEDNRNYDIVMRIPEEKRSTPEALGNLLITAPDGLQIPLGQLADIEMTEGPLQISREEGMRRIGIEMNIQGRDIGSFVREAKQRIRKSVSLPDGYHLAWGGQFENQQRALNKLLIIGPAVAAIILLLLYLTFRSIRLSLLVLLNLPFALIGGVISLYLSGLYLSIPASVGFIVLFGVAVLNGMVLVSRISQLRSEGMDLADAVSQGCMNRLRPVMMTATIAIFSLVPMIFATGTGSEIQKPLAVVVVGGLFTSTILTLLFIPSIYGWFEKQPGTLNNGD